MKPRFTRLEKAGLAVFDSQFPQKEPLAFRNAEINEYLKRINNFKSFTMFPMKPGEDAAFKHGYGISRREFLLNKKGYLRHYTAGKDRIRYLSRHRGYEIGLGYSFFLAETYVLLPFYEKHSIPFVFTLYPGGGFGLDFEASDRMLKKIFNSKCFRAVIVTQEITKNYLLKRRLCSDEDINYVYGGFVQFHKQDVRPKRYYKKDKETFDVCFVAAKYSDKGVDKGYDLFIETAKLLCKKTEDIMFHVVGGFDESDIDISEIKSRIKFYGYNRPDFLLELYSSMDVFLAPNRPFELFEGNFDGFPLGIDAGYCGTALFVADELKMNNHYKNKQDIVIVPLIAKDIADLVYSYYQKPKALYELSLKGQLVTQKLFDINYQVEQRMKVFSKFTKLEQR